MLTIVRSAFLQSSLSCTERTLLAKLYYFAFIFDEVNKTFGRVPTTFSKLLKAFKIAV